MEAIEAWWAQGQAVAVQLGGVERRVFIRRMGAGPHVTLVHGFPSSSHDWAKLAPDLARRHELLLPDLLGFGASEKPREHVYSLHEQADLVEALWRREGVEATSLVAHDYAVSIVQELLARAAEGSTETRIEGAVLLNGGLYPDLHRLQPTQEALLDPEQGAALSERLGEELFVAGLRPTFAPEYDAREDSRAIWRSVERDGGVRILHLLIAYVRDRRRHAQRWVEAVEHTDVPVSFVWGMLDPVSGAHMAERIRERMPEARLTELADVGHWPQLEAPGRVMAALGGLRP